MQKARKALHAMRVTSGPELPFAEWSPKWKAKKLIVPLLVPPSDATRHAEQWPAHRAIGWTICSPAHPARPKRQPAAVRTRFFGILLTSTGRFWYQTANIMPYVNHVWPHSKEHPSLPMSYPPGPYPSPLLVLQCIESDV